MTKDGGEKRRRAVGGDGDIEAAGREASKGASSSSVRGGRIGGCMVLSILFPCLYRDHMQMRNACRSGTSDRLKAENEGRREGLNA